MSDSTKKPTEETPDGQSQKASEEGALLDEEQAVGSEAQDASSRDEVGGDEQGGSEGQTRTVGPESEGVQEVALDAAKAEVGEAVPEVGEAVSEVDEAVSTDKTSNGRGQGGLVLPGLPEEELERVSEQMRYRPAHDGFYVSDFFLFYIVYLLVSVLLVGLSSMFLSPSAKLSQKHTLALAVQLISGVLVLGLYWFRGRSLYRLPWPVLGWKWPRWRQTLGWSLVLFPTVFLFTNAYMWLLQRWDLLKEPKQEVAKLLGPDAPLSLQLLALVLILGMAPLTEEVLFRGVLFPALRRHISVHGAALCSGLLFGLAHFEWHTIVPLALLGYLLALSFHRTGSLWLAIGLHWFNNLLAYVGLLWTTKLRQVQDVVDWLLHHLV